LSTEPPRGHRRAAHHKADHSVPASGIARRCTPPRSSPRPMPKITSSAAAGTVNNANTQFTHPRRRRLRPSICGNWASVSVSFSCRLISVPFGRDFTTLDGYPRRVDRNLRQEHLNLRPIAAPLRKRAEEKSAPANTVKQPATRRVNLGAEVRPIRMPRQPTCRDRTDMSPALPSCAVTGLASLTTPGRYPATAG
jgi:hypothetical protein